MQDQLRNGEEKTTRRPSQNQQLRPDGHKVCERVARVAPRSVVCALCTDEQQKEEEVFWRRDRDREWRGKPRGTDVVLK